MNREILFKETSEYISKNNFDFFITLHFKNEVNKSQARDSLKKFLNLLNAELFGKRSKKSLIQVSAIEKNRETKNYHLHIVFKCPNSRISESRPRDYRHLKQCIKNSWKSSSNQTAIDELNISQKSPKWIKVVHDNVGISEYISKQILEGHYDVIEWDKINITGRRN